MNTILIQHNKDFNINKFEMKNNLAQGYREYETHQTRQADSAALNNSFYS